MQNPKKPLWIILGVVLAFIFLMAVSGKISLSPKDNIILGCGLYDGLNSNPVGCEEECSAENYTYGNCVADGLAKLNAEAYDLEEGPLRNNITECLKAKGYDVPAKGIPLDRLKDALECKTAAMLGYNITETLGYGSGREGMFPIRPDPRGKSPFKNNCPPLGSKILVTLTGPEPPTPPLGHVVVCTVVACDANTGKATLGCEESVYSLNPELPSLILVNGTGGTTIILPVPLESSMDKGSCIGYTEIMNPPPK